MARKRNFLVVGATTSIGGPVVARLARNGDRVLATYHTRAPTAASANVVPARLDLSDDADLARFAGEAVPGFGALDAAVFLTGILPGDRLADYTPADIDRVMTVNFTGQAKLLRLLLPAFVEGALVLMMSSISAQRGSYDPIYAASKGALLSFVKALAAWHAPAIRVNAIAPALIADSTMYREMAPERRAHHLAQTPMGRLLDPADLAAAIADLCQGHWSHLNGACIDLNGGQYVR